MPRESLLPKPSGIRRTNIYGYACQLRFRSARCFCPNAARGQSVGHFHRSTWFDRQTNASAGHVVFNDNWKDSQQQVIQDTGIPPMDDRESAIVIALDPGAYTAIIAGKNSSTGIGLVEVYDLGAAGLDNSGTVKLAEISTRGTVLSGDNVMIGGFIISTVQTKIITRAIGPSLGAFGIANALLDPSLELHNGSGTTVRSNDNWKIREDDSSQQAEVEATTVPPTDDRESAIVETLSPGPYTAIVRGVNGTSGIAVVEVYALQ